MNVYDELKFNAEGLIPAIIQERATGRVLMMAWMNRASLEQTLATGKTHFWSRSRQKFWMKGESSGHVQHVKDVAFDCDGDTLLIQVEQAGAACHQGYKSCFFRSVQQPGATIQVTEPQPQFARVALTDYVPAGFEIDNPRLVSSGDTGTLDWIDHAGDPVKIGRAHV